MDVPKLVNKVILGELKIDDFITHTFETLGEVNKSIDVLHSGQCLRAIVKINPSPALENDLNTKVEASVKHFGGALKTVSFWSKANNCQMKFKIFLPNDLIQGQRGNPYPVLYFLAGLTCNTDNAP